MSVDETIELALRSLFAAADEDVATGGPDLVRGIYPTVATIDADGFRALSDDDVAARAQALLGGAARGGNETQGPPTGNGAP
jgi:proteasome beta subunit